MIISNKVPGSDTPHYNFNIPGKKIDNGRYKLTLTAHKSISGANGYRTSSIPEDEDAIIIDYKYPVPVPEKEEIVPFYFIQYDSVKNSYRVNYALNYKCEYAPDVLVDGAYLIVSESSNKIKNEINFKWNNKFEHNYIPKLSHSAEGIMNKIVFDFTAHDKEDDIFKRYPEKSEEDSLPSWSILVTDEDYTKHTEIINLGDDIVQETLESWKEIAWVENENKEFEEKEIGDNLNFTTIKNSTLPIIPKSKRIEKITEDGIKYNFFYSKEGGPYYRSKKYLRKVGNTQTYQRRYDSIPVIFEEDEGIELSDECNVNIDFSTTYNNFNNTLNLDLEYHFKDPEGNEIAKDEINYAHMTITNKTTGEEFTNYDFKDKTSSHFIGLSPGFYQCDAIIHNEYLKSDSYKMNPLVIDVRPTFEEGITVEKGTTDGVNYYEDSYLVDENGVKKFKIVIKWSFNVTSKANFKINFGKMDFETEVPIKTYDSFIYNNLVIDDLESGTYYFYVTYDSDQCKDISDRLHYETITIPERTQNQSK